MSNSAASFDVFVSCPMAAAQSEERYQSLRAEALRVVDCLEKDCGMTAFFAGRNVDSPDGFDEPDYAVVRDLGALRASRYFLLLYPERMVSSVLVEAGYALALDKKAVYFVKDSKHLPFMLRHLDRVFPAKVYEYTSVEKILRLLREHGKNLFEPWREQQGLGTAPTLNTRTPNEVSRELIAETRIGPYTLVERIGSGTYGVVWLAERRGGLATTKFAIKIPNTGANDRQAVRREAEVWVQASGHGNVMPVVEAEIYDGYLAIVSQYAPDGCLHRWLKKNGGKAPSVETAIEITSGILNGLEHLHQRKLIHRDLKPANVLLEGLNPRIADFGLARILQHHEDSTTIAGTPAYMAPEAWEGDRSVTVDLWSVGVMLYEMLSGRLPFSGENANAVRDRVRNGLPDTLPDDLPESLKELVYRSLSRNPGNRFQSAQSMAETLVEQLYL